MQLHLTYFGGTVQTSSLVYE